MRLESLKIQGFKSFADKVELVFKPGITAIVGPNGSGKSNITDAIRWVLGEQSAKSLRGGQMEDVIFNGSACRQPKGMAEVSLKLTNLGSLPIPFQEVVITRRIFRAGENEYFINKNHCRLKDIVEMFLDTGLGKGTCSIIEQGKVDFVIMAKPKERRSLIESAAGILKYKAKREEALKKMEATSQNLERLRDIMNEVEKQKETLSVQAERAMAYKEYRRQEEELIYKIALGQYLSLQKQEKELTEKLRYWKDQEVAVNSELGRSEAEIERVKISLLECEEQISSLRKTAYALESQINSFSQQQQSYESEAVRLEEEQMNINFELEELHTSQIRVETDLLAAEKGLKEKEKIFQEKREELTGLEEEYSALQKSVQGKEHQYEMRRKDILGLTNQEARLENLCENLRAKQKEIQGRQEGLKKVLYRLGEDLQIKEAERKKLQGRIEQQKRCLEEIRQQEADLSERMEVKSEEVREADLRVRALDKKLQSGKSFLHSLGEIFERKEGYQDSVRHLLLAREKNQREVEGLRGVIAELITVPPEYEKAIEAVLENYIQCMVVDTFEDGLVLLQYLKGQKVGRGTFMALETADAAGQAIQSLDIHQAIKSLDIQRSLEIQGIEIQGVSDIREKIRLAVEVIKYEQRYEKIMAYFFGSTILVDDLSMARQVLKEVPGQYRVATRSGEILSSCGIISGGGPEKASPSFLARKRQVEELRVSISLLQSEMGQEETARSLMSREVEEIRREKESLNHRHHQLEISLNGLQKDLSHVDVELMRDQRRVEEVEYKKGRSLADEEELAADLKNQQERLNKTKEEKSRVEQEIKTFSQELNTSHQQDRDLQERMTGSKIALTSVQEHQKALKLSLRRYKESQVENAKRIGNFQNKLEKIVLSRKKNEQNLNELHSQLPQLEQSRKTATLDLQKLETLRSEKIELIRSTEKGLKKTYQRQNQIIMEIQKIGLHMTEIQTHIEHVLRDNHISLGQVTESRSEEQVTEPPTEQVTDPPSEAQIQVFQGQLQETRARISSLGVVNLMAIEEYKKLLDRYGFLSQQEEDMRNSLDSLHSLITRINRDSCLRFKQAFENINLNFQTIFKKLFEGGRAELLLEQPDDLLETGVEVVAQPPGKKPQYLSLLSGGEKAMTAIALILAIYLLKPSPFCLLDEIDAPLDEANIDRFLNLLNEFKQRTQFLIITHSKKTMQMANVIYGVTTEQPGLSSVVSLELSNCEL